MLNRGHPVYPAGHAIGCNNSKMDGGVLEGWYTDPYQRHEERWISKGIPTRLVRDLGIEGDDPVELMPFKASPVRGGHVDAAFHGASDLRRTDDGYRNLDLKQRKGVNFSLAPPTNPASPINRYGAIAGPVRNLPSSGWFV